MSKDTKVIIKILLDLILLLLVGIPILLFHLHGKPFKRGFFCDDDSIRYPFSESTITSNALYVIGVFLPITVISLNEFVTETRTTRDDRGKVYIFRGRPVPNVIWRIYKRVGIFLYGACMSQLTTDIAKYSIGRLRPHFLDICKPSVNCSLVADPHAYQTEFECLNTEKPFYVREARLSFPSGHSSFSAYTMIFTVLYLQSCMCVKGNKLLKPFIQFILIMMTWYTALSRISDYKHHWSDVLIGFLLGTLVASINVFCVSDFFNKRKQENENFVLQDIAIESPVSNYNTMNKGPDEGVR
ncbi:putative phosphatidate phosphatase [Parasteatoda tepidariorum]|nr:putative phosphatidate phosphatase [Parasteatoda tepidariorum]